MALELVPEQEHGARWLASRKTALLADDMGFGKTAQLIRGADYCGARDLLVVCPASGPFHWEREINAWGQIPRGVSLVLERNTVVPSVGTVVVPWSLVATPGIANQLRRRRFDVLILDESQFAKSDEADRTLIIYGSDGIVHSADRAWCASGTPMPKHPGELYPMLKVLYPAALERPGGGGVMDTRAFEDRFRETRVRRHKGRLIKTYVGGKNLPELRERITPFFLRRKLTESTLPPLRMGIVPLQAARFDRLPIEHDTANTLQRAVFAADVEDWASATVALDQAADSNEFSTVRRLIGVAKAPAVVKLIAEEFRQGLDKIVVWAWHSEVIDILRRGLDLFGCVVLDGSTPKKQRDDNVAEFQNDPTCRVFIGQIVAAGTLITLTAACHALFAEWHTVPGDMAQAIKRISRRGQTRPCLARFATLAGSIDEPICEILRRRTADIAQVFA